VTSRHGSTDFCARWVHDNGLGSPHSKPCFCNKISEPKRTSIRETHRASHRNLFLQTSRDIRADVCHLLLETIRGQLTFIQRITSISQCRTTAKLSELGRGTRSPLARLRASFVRQAGLNIVAFPSCHSSQCFLIIDRFRQLVFSNHQFRNNLGACKRQRSLDGGRPVREAPGRELNGVRWFF
jgi:hypothetical protein